MANFDDMKLAVEALSGGKNTVLFDDMGMPSVMFPFVKQKYSDLMEGGTQETFPCFRIENEEKDVIYISKFLNRSEEHTSELQSRNAHSVYD